MEIIHFEWCSCFLLLGSLKWKFYIGDIVFSSPAIGVDGSIYVGSFNHYFYAIGSDGSL